MTASKKKAVLFSEASKFSKSWLLPCERYIIGVSLRIHTLWICCLSPIVGNQWTAIAPFLWAYWPWRECLLRSPPAVRPLPRCRRGFQRFSPNQTRKALLKCTDKLYRYSWRRSWPMGSGGWRAQLLRNAPIMAFCFAHLIMICRFVKHIGQWIHSEKAS